MSESSVTPKRYRELRELARNRELQENEREELLAYECENSWFTADKSVWVRLYWKCYRLIKGIWEFFTNTIPTVCIRKPYQRWRYGCTNEETWSICHNEARRLVPRLKRFKELKNGYPCTLPSMADGGTDEHDVRDSGGPMAVANTGRDEQYERRCIEEWDEILDKMIFAFERIAEDDFHDYMEYPPDYKHGFVIVPCEDSPNTELMSLDDRSPNIEPMKEVQRRVEEGLDLFARYFQALWW